MGLSGAAEGISRAHLSWDAKAVCVVTSTTGKIICVSMDGTAATDYSNVLRKAITTSRRCPTGARGDARREVAA